MKKTVIIILMVGTFIVPKNIYSQTKDELKNKIQKTEETIKLTNELLEKTEKNRDVGLNKLLIVKKRIELRERLINEISEEIDNLDGDISKNKDRINSLEKEIEELKEEYAKLIYFAYKNKDSYNRIMFILSAEDFNQAYRRMKYLQQYTNYRKKQANRLFVAKKNLEYEVEQLEEKRAEKLSFLERKEKENKYLNTEKRRETSELNKLKVKEKELREKIKENERIKAQLTKEIAELIAKEAEKNKNSKLLTATEEVISRDFGKSKGKLNWPIEKGIVIREFGEHPHPVIKGIKIKNEGIDITSTADAKVKAIFKGEVKKVIAIPGANMAVIIRHGHYLSFYSNIVNVRVKPGDMVEEGEQIGDIYFTNSGDNSSVLHFRIYEETNVYNPKDWLKKM